MIFLLTIPQKYQKAFDWEAKNTTFESFLDL